MVNQIVFVFAGLIDLYTLLIFVYVLGSWLPQLKASSWFRYIEDIVAPYLNLFRNLPLAGGGIDFSPMVAIMALYFFRYIVISSAHGGL